MLILGRPYKGSPGRSYGSMLIAACVRREELGTPSRLHTSRVRRKAWHPNDAMLHGKLLFRGPSTQLVGAALNGWPAPLLTCPARQPAWECASCSRADAGNWLSLHEGAPACGGRTSCSRADAEGPLPSAGTNASDPSGRSTVSSTTARPARPQTRPAVHAWGAFAPHPAQTRVSVCSASGVGCCQLYVGVPLPRSTCCARIDTSHPVTPTL